MGIEMSETTTELVVLDKVNFIRLAIDLVNEIEGPYSPRTVTSAVIEVCQKHGILVLESEIMGVLHPTSISGH